MKRRDLIRRVETMGYRFLREGGNHTIYTNAEKTRMIAIPRHKEINEDTARAMLKRLGGSK